MESRGHQFVQGDSWLYSRGYNRDGPPLSASSSASSRVQDDSPVLRERKSSIEGGSATSFSTRIQPTPNFNLNGGGLSGSSSAAAQDGSTSAALSSPTIYTGRTAMSRFANQTLYAASDPSPNFDHHSTYSDAELGSIPATSSTSFVNAYSRSYSHTNQNPNQPKIPQRISPTPWSVKSSSTFAARRKRSTSPNAAFLYTPSKRRFSLRKLVHSLPPRPQLSVLTGIIVLLLYILTFRVRIPAIPSNPEILSDYQEAAKEQEPIQLPKRKWWEPPDTDPATPSLPLAKRTSFATPRHTYPELMKLPSRYASHSTAMPNYEQQIQQQEYISPSISALIDCSSPSELSQLFLSNNIDSLNLLLHTLAKQSVIFSSVNLLVSPNQPSLANKNLFGLQNGWLSIHIQDAHSSDKGLASSPALRGLETDYILFLSCPGVQSGDLERQNEEANAISAAITALLHAAGTDAYSTSVLATSGMNVKYQEKYDNRQASKTPPGREIIAQAIFDLDESRALNIPLPPLLLQTAWSESLESILSAQEVSQSSNLDIHFGIATRIALSLRRSLNIKSYGIPLPQNFRHKMLAGSEDTFSSTKALLQTVDRKDLQLWLTGQEMLEDSANIDEGSPARVAFILLDNTAEISEYSKRLICNFAKEQHYGHQIRVFVPSSSATLFGAFITECPEVSVESLDASDLKDWVPDICLAATAHLVHTQWDCQKIVMKEEELRYIEWLPSLPLESLRNWNKPQIDLVVITNNRPASLHRLLTSLSSAFYLSDNVNLFINLEQTADAMTCSLVQNSSWPFGTLTLRHRIVLGGLMPSIVESWYPANNDTYGVFLEDDVEVSRQFYAWLKFTILYYRYGSSSTRTKARRLLGISLYQPKNIELRPEGRRKFDAHRMFRDMGIPSTLPYLSQIPCSWGAAYFPEHWREFHQFLSLRLAETSMDLSDVIIPDIRSNRWPRSWKRYINELIYLRGYTMLYPNYEDFRSLSTNHLELGTHVKDDLVAQKRRDIFKVPLLNGEDSLLAGLVEDRLPLWDTMPVVDFWGNIVTQDEIVERAKVTMTELALCPSIVDEQMQKQGNAQNSYDASELLCPSQRDVSREYDVAAAISGGRATPSAETREVVLNEWEARLVEREARLAEMEGIWVEDEQRQAWQPEGDETQLEEEIHDKGISGLEHGVAQEQLPDQK